MAWRGRAQQSDGEVSVLTVMVLGTSYLQTGFIAKEKLRETQY
jgi:hypothetical protein